ncbi:hypothetical protein B4589_003885 [Halolamina sp. CBA1230]|uniref:hypothetical protein n=1 Tax=Halolamina sp. CBA1230 TaxID=1853690 RepID=UPI0009A1BAEC|nr:hypothetical protein [Halolamina sp. CBA1230]QKY19558.1 hypothetical protein B4589_003885 [Halolamina sp. CBA1230]
MDVDCLATSRIAGQPNASAVDSLKLTWRTVRRFLPKFTGFVCGYPESGAHHRLATGEAAS